ncbi:MAG: hypothetical protein P4M07_09295 [Xanthobacteraceae bacterium]|nr:hypothetical protein [Xanthobacteraceae bacterium]
MSDPPPSDLAARLAAAASAAPPPIGACAGRGIVICAGGTRLLTCAWLTIAMLRRTFACRLPIELWHIGPNEMGAPMRTLLEALDVRITDALTVARHHPVDSLGGWQLKTYALMHSEFREMLLLDADNMPTRDPSFLFEAAEFADAGAVFWPDIVRFKAGNPVWQVTGLPPDGGPSFETGQFLIDKERHWRALTLADWINQNHLAFEDMLYGDKDACYVAWRMVGAPYRLIRHAPRQLEHTFCQRAPDGEVLFQHRNGAKWLLHGPNPHIEGFRFETECLTLLAELRTLWDGTLFNPPQRSAAAQALERELSELGRFRLVWVGSHAHVVTLRPQHVVEGGSPDERCWFVADGANGPELRIVARGLLTCALRRAADGIWRGTAGAFSVELHPEVPDFARGREAPAGETAVLLAAVDRLLDGAGPDSSGEQGDLAVTLAVLAGLDDALVPHLARRAEGPSHAAAAARAALARLQASPGAAMVRRGSGWLSPSGNLSTQTEPVPRR